MSDKKASDKIKMTSYESLLHSCYNGGRDNVTSLLYVLFVASDCVDLITVENCHPSNVVVCQHVSNNTLNYSTDVYYDDDDKSARSAV